MHRINIILFLLMFTLFISACIKPFEPNIKSSDLKKYVVSGQVTNGDGNQIVNVSITSSINDPQYLPVTSCSVAIVDDKNHRFAMNDEETGDYTTWIDPNYLVPGAVFMVEVTTPDGIKLVSDYDTMSRAPAVDSVYFVRKDIEGNTPGTYTLGIQFYINLNGDNTDGHFYLWDLFETWEYHADYPLEWWYDGTIHHEVPPDYSRNVCWRTLKIPKIFTLSTNNLVENKSEMIPLQYVDNRTSRLAYGYSLLVEQIALSESAFNYWDQLRINSGQDGGLYEQQPLSVKGNMHNLTRPDDEVIGFFSVNFVTQKRIFVNPIAYLPLDFETYCSPTALRKGLREFIPRDYPAYLMGDEVTWFPVWLNHECVNCLLLGGINVKPEFWPY